MLQQIVQVGKLYVERYTPQDVSNAMICFKHERLISSFFCTNEFPTKLKATMILLMSCKFSKKDLNIVKETLSRK